MSPEEQRIAIAEACGHKIRIDEDKRAWVEIKDGLWGLVSEELPDYLHDLNAMNEVLSNMDWGDNKWKTYQKNLHEICKAEGHPEWFVWYIEHNATAAQRAEAFLKTLGLWKDSTTY
jgi:hypothetical protein